MLPDLDPVAAGYKVPHELSGPVQALSQTTTSRVPWSHLEESWSLSMIAAAGTPAALPAHHGTFCPGFFLVSSLTGCLKFMILCSFDTLIAPNFNISTE